MAHDLTTPLTAEEFAALKEASRGIAQLDIRQEHAERLVELGYLVRRLGSLSVTVAGNLRLAAGK